ncbi:LarC family nickel insertion protein [Sodalis sp. RH21]|uniref:LarC family nickel insertion protein n=1 Tax=unclassified Sodalis (in: enterobacteria) TaxID=2636512 RepID=UPI0039B4FA7F
MHIHLDVVGGIAGDMFAAAMLDAFPGLRQPLLDLLAGLDFPVPVAVALASARDHGLTGYRFQVTVGDNPAEDTRHLSTGKFTAFTASPPGAGRLDVPRAVNNPDHFSWPAINAWLRRAPLPEPVRAGALAIYTLLVAAEGQVHGIAAEQVHLHEVGATDALADIISAAFLAVSSGAQSWSVSPLPWGGGTVNCAHGEIPVPAPATLALLRDFHWRDDNQPGERVTPTGAAILAWLKPGSRTRPGRAGRIGYGFGRRQLAGKANLLRVCPLTPQASWSTEQISILQCDIDDMTPELLAIAQQNLRTVCGVVDITSQTLQGKKNRWVMRLELLCLPEYVLDILSAVFMETSTLGVRYWLAERAVLPREGATVCREDGDWAVKYALRPDGVRTCKIEADELALYPGGHWARQEIKADIEHRPPGSLPPPQEKSS